MSSTKFRLAVFASGSGTNAEEIFIHFKNHPAIEVVLLLSNNPNAFALERARKFSIPTRVFTKQEFAEADPILKALQEKKVTHIALAGFLWMIPDYLIQAFPEKIINIHPSLLPKFGGKGMYGIRIHEAVKAAGEKESGITIHQVDANYDEGKVLFQAKCSIEDWQTPQQINECIHKLEYEHYPGVIEKWILGRL